MRYPLALAAALLLAAGQPAHAGRITSGLEAQLQGLAPSDEVKVLVVMRDQAPIPALDAELHARLAPRAERHASVVESLRGVASTSQGAILADLAARQTAGEVRGFTPYWLINAITVVTTVEGVRDLALRTDVDVIEADLVVELIQPIRPPLDKIGDGNAAQAIGIAPGIVSIQARRVWQELGINGTGALVANMDTGVDATHPSLSARWRGNFAPAAECWRDAVGFGHLTPQDLNNHGTHVMGTITGVAPNDTIGVAPGALWIADNSINQGVGSAFDNDVLGALQWFSDPDGNAFTTADVPDVVQNSWGINEGFGGSYVDCDSRWWIAMDNCEAAGVVLTWSAGNEGPGGTSLRSPADRATSPYNSFSVGSTLHSAPFTISGFSSRGPSGCGGAFAMKPEVSAPGESIYSAMPGGGYQLLSGTSMAGPHVAGVVGLMRSANPDLDVQTIKQILMDTTTDLGAVGEDNTYGHGFINAYEAVLAVLDGYGTITGTIRDAGTNAPIAGAFVEIAGDPRNATTNASGVFSLMLPQGPWTLDVSAFGYLSGSVGVTVIEDQTVDGSLNLTSAPSATVSGVVTDFTSAFVDDAEISVLGTPITPVNSNPDGSYSIQVPTGATYDIRARKDGLSPDTHTLLVNANMTQDFVLGELTIEDFESGNFLVWPWSFSGNAPWTISTVTPYEGTYSARSGDINDNQTSSMTLVVTSQSPGNVTFFRRIESEATYDFLRFSIDGSEVGSWSGTIPWGQVSFPVSAGQHTYLWSYTKDVSVSTGADAAWVDAIDLPFVGPPLLPEIATSPGSLSETLGPNQTSQDVIQISNSGNTDLLWNASIVLPSILQAMDEAVAPDFDQPGGRAAGEGESILGSGGPDAFGYRWIDSDQPGGPGYQWFDISGGLGTPLNMDDHSFSGPHQIGFPFSFYGSNFSTLYISSNGFVTFNSAGNFYDVNGPIPSVPFPNNLVAAYWDDLHPGAGGTIYKYQDVANGRFVVQWNAVPHKVGSGGGNPQTFQIFLYNDGTIVYQYKIVSETTDSTVGIENGPGNVGLQTVFNAAYLHNDLAVRISTVPWITWVTLGSTSGSVPEGSSQNLLVNYNSAGLPNGVYDAFVRIGSNDISEPTTDVPVTLTVNDATGIAEIGAPRVFELGSSLPNPFGARTTLTYAVPVEGRRVSIRVFDVSGRLVRTLVDGPGVVGRHAVDWDGRSDGGTAVGSGVYFYRMDAGEFTQIRKMTLLK